MLFLPAPKAKMNNKPARYERLTIMIMAQRTNGQPVRMKIVELTRSPQEEWPSLTDILEGKIGSAS